MPLFPDEILLNPPWGFPQTGPSVKRTDRAKVQSIRCTIVLTELNTFLYTVPGHQEFIGFLFAVRQTPGDP